MLRLPLLAAAAFLLPNIDSKPAAPVHAAQSAAEVTSPSLPGLRLPKFIRNRNRGIEMEVTAMKTRLRDLVIQQESWYAAHNSYGRNAMQIAQATPGDSSARDVQIQILFANTKGWSAIASHPNAPGRSCVAYVGLPEALPIIPRTRLEANEATMEGIPACDSK